MRRTPLHPGTKPLKRTALRQKSNSHARRERDRRDAELRAAVKARDGGLCRLCGQSGDETAHCYSKGAHPEWRWMVWNAAYLCWRCHDEAHDKPEVAKVLKRMADVQRAEERSRQAAGELGGEFTS